MASMTAAQIAKELRALPQEVKQAGVKASRQAATRLRAKARREAKGKIDKPKERVRGRPGTLWIGADPLPVDWRPGALSVVDRVVFIDGQRASDAFRMDPTNKTTIGEWASEDWITMRRLSGKNIERYDSDIDREFSQIFDAADDEAADIYLEEFDKELKRLTGAA